MRRLLLAALTLGLLATAAPAAQAATYGFSGGCSWTAVNSASLSEEGWTGVVRAAVVATADDLPAPDAPVTDVWCALMINGSPHRVLTAPDGTGATATAGPVQYAAWPDDVVEMCTHATIGGTPSVRCHGGSSAPIVPMHPIDHVGMIVDAINEVFYEIDPVVCERLRAVAPVVNALGRPDLLYVEPTYGDVYVAGEFFWDCLPHEPWEYR